MTDVNQAKPLVLSYLHFFFKFGFGGAATRQPPPRPRYTNGLRCSEIKRHCLRSLSRKLQLSKLNGCQTDRPRQWKMRRCDCWNSQLVELRETAAVRVCFVRLQLYVYASWDCSCTCMLLACRVHSEIQATVRVVLSELHLIRTSVFYVTFSLLLFHIILGGRLAVSRPTQGRR